VNGHGRGLATFLGATLMLLSALHSAPAQAEPPRPHPAVILAFDNSGDFGPGTPGTRTSGWQEALDFCVAQARDLYVQGGYGGRQAVYHIDTTVYLPPAQDFRIDGGVYVLNYRGPDDGADALVMDSAMNCDYRLGIIVYGGRGAGLRVRPRRPVPIDGFPVVIETQLTSQGIADPHPFRPGRRETGTGLVFDAATAGIHYSTFYFASVLNFATCIRVEDAGSFHANQLVCEHLHTNAHQSTLLELGAAANACHLRCGIGVDQGATEVTGLVVAASHNVLDVATRPGGFAPGRQVVLAQTAHANRLQLRTAEDPRQLLTDLAAEPTNQVSWTGGPLPVERVHAPAGRFTHVQRLWPAAVALEQGSAARLLFGRGQEEIAYPPDAEVQLSVGDRLTVESPTPVVLRVVPQQR